MLSTDKKEPGLGKKKVDAIVLCAICAFQRTDLSRSPGWGSCQPGGILPRPAQRLNDQISNWEHPAGLSWPIPLSNPYHC